MTPGEAFDPRPAVCGVYVAEIVARRKDITAAQKLLYWRLVSWCGRNGSCWHGYDGMADALGCSARQAKRDIAALERVGLVRHVRRGKGLSNTYAILWHDSFTGNAESEVTPVSHHSSASEVTSTSPVKGHRWSSEVTPVSPESSRESRRESTKKSTLHPSSSSSAVVDAREGNCVQPRGVIPIRESAPVSPRVVRLPPDQDPAFQSFVWHFMSLGVAISQPQMRKLAGQWGALDEPEREKALAHVASVREEWLGRATKFVPMPWNYLDGGAWNAVRVAPPRRAKTEGELALERASEAFLAERRRG